MTLEFIYRFMKVGDVLLAEKYWLHGLGMDKFQMHKTMIATSISSKGLKGDILPNGTCHLRSSSTELKQKVLRWMELALL